MSLLGSKDVSLNSLLLACALGATQVSGRSCEVKWPNEGIHPCDQAHMAKSPLDHLCG